MALLRRLDRCPPELFRRALDPEVRTIDGEPLTPSHAELLLACTAEDMKTLAELMQNERVLLREMRAQFNALLAPYGLPGEDTDEVLARMPVTERREARRLINGIRLLIEQIPKGYS
jgi:hypothetical protein